MPKNKGKQQQLKEQPLPKQAKQQQKKHVGNAATTAASWPEVGAKQDLVLTPWLEERLYTVDGALAQHECAAWVQYAEQRGFATVDAARPPKGYAVRVNDRMQWQDPVLAQHLWERCVQKVAAGLPNVETRRPVACNDNIRLYRYLPGHRFAQHIDDTALDGFGRQTEYTVLIYLTGGADLLGGDTIFYKNARYMVVLIASS